MIKIPPLPKFEKPSISVPQLPKSKTLEEVKGEILSELKAVIKEEVRRLTPKEFEFNTDAIIHKIRQMVKDGKDGKNAEINYGFLTEKVIEGIKGLQGDDRLQAKHIAGVPLHVPKQHIDFNDMRWHGGGGTGTANSPVSGETPTGLINGSNKSYTLANVPVSGTLKVFIDGVRITDFTLVATTLTVTLAPTTTIICDYEY